MSITYFVYKWTNTSNGKCYIGSHQGSLTDGYIGSGKYFKRAYMLEPDKFVRTILGFYENAESMKIGESEFLVSVNAISNPMYYNLTNSSCGGDLHAHLTSDEKTEIYSKWKSGAKLHLANMTEEDKLALKKKKQDSWASSPKLSNHIERTKARRLAEEQQKTTEDKLRFSETCQNVYWSRSKEEIESHHMNQSKGMAKFYDANPSIKEERAKLLRTINIGKICINKDGKTKKINSSMLQEYLNDGWALGMSKRKPKS